VGDLSYLDQFFDTIGWVTGKSGVQKTCNNFPKCHLSEYVKKANQWG